MADPHSFDEFDPTSCLRVQLLGGFSVSIDGAALAAERWPPRGTLSPALRWLPHLYTLSVVTIGWVLFRADGLRHAKRYLGAMFGANELERVLHPLVHYTDAKLLTLVALAVIGCAPWLPRIVGRGQSAAPRLLALARTAGVALLLLASALTLSAGTHNPFIYFRF